MNLTRRVEIFDPVTGKAMMFVPFVWMARLIVKHEAFKHCDYGLEHEISWV